MTWYYGTFSCGHEGGVDICGIAKYRKYKAERAFEGLCEECLQKQREEENQKAIKKAKEMGLPDLQGTEKQIAWANVLRVRFVKMAENVIEMMKDNEMKSYWYEVLDYILTTKIKAIWYIDNKDINAIADIKRVLKQVSEEMEKRNKKLKEEQQEKDIRMESAVFPENAITNVIVDIMVQDDKVLTKFEINETFIDIVKSLGYQWEGGVWKKDICETTGTAQERAAELGNKLLNAGFPISILDEEIRQNAINGKFEPECKRWIHLITEGDYKGWLGLQWKGKNEVLYNNARRITGSKWNKPYVVVKIERYNEVEDFAEIYEFKFTKKAKKAIEDYKESFKNITQVIPKKVKQIEQKDILKEILNSSDEVLEDLIDD